MVRLVFVRLFFLFFSASSVFFVMIGQEVIKAIVNIREEWRNFIDFGFGKIEWNWLPFKRCLNVCSAFATFEHLFCIFSQRENNKFIDTIDRNKWVYAWQWFSLAQSPVIFGPFAGNAFLSLRSSWIQRQAKIENPRRSLPN